LDINKNKFWIINK